MGKGRETKYSGPAADFKPDALDQYKTGQNVGHGVDHDCVQCRQTRQKLHEAGLVKPGQANPDAPDQPAIPDPNDRGPASDPMIGGGEVPEVFRTSEPGLSSSSAEQTQDDLTRAGFPATLEESTASNDAARAVATLADPRKGMESAIAQIEKAIERAITAAFYTAGLRELPSWDVIDDAVSLLDLLQDRKPGTAYMIMQGYQPGDDRVHCELTHSSGARAHVKQFNRSIAIKLAVLTLIDAQSGAQMERALSGFNQPQAVPFFTGATPFVPRTGLGR